MTTPDGRVERLKEKIAAEYEKRQYLTYHNWVHTCYVLKEAEKLAEATEADPAIVCPASILHDTGHFYSAKGEDHEQIGAAQAKDFLTEFTAQEITRIQACIKATNYMVAPQTIEEEVVKDADNSQFARPDYFAQLVILAEELATRGVKTNIEEIMKNTYDFIVRWFHLEKNGIEHAFYTTRAKELYRDQLKRNLDDARNFKKIAFSDNL